MNLAEIEQKITSTTFEFTGYKGRVHNEVLDWHTLWCGTNAVITGIEVEGLGRLFVQVRQGGEGQGDEAWVVVRIENLAKNEIRYFRKDGYYASYDGAEFDGAFYEVEPVERLVIRYEEI